MLNKVRTKSMNLEEESNRRDKRRSIFKDIFILAPTSVHLREGMLCEHVPDSVACPLHTKSVVGL